MKRKIGILTLPLINNYGGILQAYALSVVLRELKVDVLFIDYQKKCMSKTSVWLSNIKNFAKQIFPSLFFGRAPAVTPSIRASISKNTRSFVCSEIVPISSVITEVDELKRLVGQLDGIIVGSDQVWRPAYTPRVESYFLDFLGNDKLKIAYAASFGSDNWSFSKEQLHTFVNAIKEFDFVSVRETSAVDAIKARCGVEAKCALDPTLLLSSQHYMDLVNRLGHCSFDGDLFCYSLDETPFFSSVSSNLATKYGFKPYHVKPKNIDLDYHKNPEKYIYPPVSDWLSAFINAKFVVADSFHGCVFSIIFNKPFFAVGNKKRGIARFSSLLALFGLESRLIMSEDDLDEERINYSFDWVAINERWNSLKRDSLEYLEKSLQIDVA